MKQIIRFFVGLVPLIAVACATGAQQVKVTDQETDDGYTLRIDLPAVNFSSEVNQAAADTVDRWKADFLSSMKDLRNAGSEAPGEFIVGWEEAQADENRVSILLQGYSYTGGANGQDLLSSFNWDVAQKQWITLESLTGDSSSQLYETISQLAREQLKKEINPDGDAVLDSMIDSGTEPVADNFSTFTISQDNTITFYFNKYQVAPGSYGIRQAAIPLSSLIHES